MKRSLQDLLTDRDLQLRADHPGTAYDVWRGLERRQILAQRPRHTADCWARGESLRLSALAWAMAHPWHCRECNGWGGAWSRYDPSPAGVALSPGSMMDFDECGGCLAQGYCPHCGAELADQAPEGAEPPCRCECGWNEEEPEGIPNDGDCSCWHLDWNGSDETWSPVGTWGLRTDNPYYNRDLWSAAVAWGPASHVFGRMPIVVATDIQENPDDWHLSTYTYPEMPPDDPGLFYVLWHRSMFDDPSTEWWQE